MDSLLTWSKEASTRFPNLLICAGVIRDVKVERNAKETNMLKQAILTKMRQDYRVERLKDNATVRAYRETSTGHWTSTPQRPDRPEKPC